jgi:hypothetical protein
MRQPEGQSSKSISTQTKGLESEKDLEVLFLYLEKSKKEKNQRKLDPEKPTTEKDQREERG